MKISWEFSFSECFPQKKQVWGVSLRAYFPINRLYLINPMQNCLYLKSRNKVLFKHHVGNSTRFRFSTLQGLLGSGSGEEETLERYCACQLSTVSLINFLQSYPKCSLTSLCLNLIQKTLINIKNLMPSLNASLSILRLHCTQPSFLAWVFSKA